jgi:hypothetical protein
MDKDKTSLERTVLRIGSMISAVLALFAGINGVFDQVKTTVRVLTGFDKWQLGVAALALVAFSLWLFRLSRRRRSVLLRPEALRLERGNPAHLFGRADDIVQLTRLCREQSLVFLEGESGVGKSALLQAGLVPALKGDAEVLPVYVESLVGSDWEREPRRFLAAALWTALDEASRGVLELKAVPGPDAVRAAIGAIRSTLGRTPLLVLDQFDDYQTRHRERFLSGKTWLKPGKLAEQNGFWRDIRELLTSLTIHLVVVTRTDTALGLTCVRFTEPETYRLDRLSSHFVGPLLSELAKGKDEQAVIGDPEYGWVTLLARLSADLERAGTILPQQLKIVLAGLGTLPGRVLTVASYERAGGAAGLETRFIEDRIAKVARLYGTTEERVRTALLALVDPAGGQRTIQRGNDELLSCIEPAAPDRAQPALNLLSQEEVIRRRVEPGTGETSWLLDHDYLARAVREAGRRANRWQRALVEGATALAEAGDGWARQWRALLPPRTQLAFLYDRVRGRFRYGEHRLYAVKSLQRFGPYIAGLLLVVGLVLYEGERRSEERIQASADDILNGLELRSPFEENQSEVEALLRLASAEEPVRQVAMTLVLTNPDRARIFVRQPELVVRAIVGVSPRFRALATASLAGRTASFSSGRPETSRAIADAALLLGPSAVLPPGWWVAAIESTTDPEALKALGTGLGGAFPVTLTDRQAKDAVRSFLAAIKSAPYYLAAESVGAGLGALTAKFTDSQAKEALEPFLAAIKGTTDADVLWVLGTGLGALSAKLTNSQAKEAVEPLLTATKSTTVPSALGALGKGLGSLRVKLTDSQAREAVEPFITAIKDARDEDPRALLDLGSGLGALPVQLTDSQAEAVVERFLAVIKSMPSEYALQTSLRALDIGLRALPAKLTDGQAKDAVEAFLVAIKSTGDPHILAVLSVAIGALPANLSEDQAKQAVEAFLAAIKNAAKSAAIEKNVGALNDLSAGLGALAAKLTDSQATGAIGPWLSAIKGTTDPDAVYALASSLGALSSELSDGQAKEAIVSVLAAIKGNPYAGAVDKGAKLGVLAAKLTDIQAKEAVAWFLAAIKGTTNPYALGALGVGLGALTAQLTDGQAKDGVEAFLAAIKDTANRRHQGLPGFEEVGAGLGALAARLTDRQAKEAVEPLLSAIKGTTDAEVLGAVGPGLEALSLKLDPPSAEAADVIASEVLEKTRNRATFVTYAKLSTMLAHHKPRDQQVTRIFHLIRHPFTAEEAATRNLLTLLERVPGVQVGFGGDLWKAVEWAEKEQKAGRLNGLDLDAPLRVPFTDGQAFSPDSPH